ncbi:hypothetical protein GCM10009760_44930 [Kitasatospora kazusensis]|uniref:ABM domain-containing protein n=1 Tax=Kitasatospora kazusensis TaxID=407974 RepID=A0ABN2ZZT2_9ACTN
MTGIRAGPVTLGPSGPGGPAVGEREAGEAMAGERMAAYGGPVRVILRMDIVPGREEEFEAVWLEIGRLIAGRPANRGQVLLRSVEEDGSHVYHVLTDWADEASFREFELSAEHVEHRRRLRPLRAGGQMTVNRTVHDLRPAPAG